MLFCITIDGLEGKTGAASLAVSDHVAFPFKQACALVFEKFERAGIAHNIVFHFIGKPSDVGFLLTNGDVNDFDFVLVRVCFEFRCIHCVADGRQGREFTRDLRSHAIGKAVLTT